MSLDGRGILAVCLGDYRGPLRADAFIRYAEGRFAREVEEFAYRAYITESIRLYGEGKVIGAKWIDVVRKEKKEKIDPEQTLKHVISKAGLVVT